MMTDGARLLIEVEYEPLAVEVVRWTDDVITCRDVPILQVVRPADRPGRSKDKKQERARLREIVDRLRANPPRGFDVIAPLAGAPPERWVDTIRRYGLPDYPGSVVSRLADLWVWHSSVWNCEVGGPLEYTVPLGWLQGYARAAQLLTAITQGEERAFTLVLEKLPEGFAMGFNWENRRDIVEEVVWDTVAQTARHGAPRSRLSSRNVKSEDHYTWSLTVAGWWHALVTTTIVRGTRYVPPKRFSCAGCGELVDTARLRGRALADGARKFCSDQCRWRVARRDHNRRRKTERLQAAEGDGHK